MGVVSTLARVEVRRRWVAVVALAVLIGLAGGVVIAAVSGAERTRQALPEFLRYNRPEDAAVANLDDLPPEEHEALAREITALPMVVDAARAAFVLLSEVEPERPSSDQAPRLSPVVVIDGGYYQRMARPLIVAGRHPRPDRAEEVAIDESLAARRGLAPGDTFDVRVHSAEQLEPALSGEAEGSGDRLVSLTVTGIERQPFDLSAVPASSLQSEDDSVYLTPAFWERYGDGIATLGSFLVVRLEEGAESVAAFEEAVLDLTGGEAFVEPGAQDLVGMPAVQQAIDVQAGALVAFGGLTALVSFLIAGQAVSREVAQAGADHAVLRSLGITRGQLVGASLCRAGVVGLAAAGLAVGTAVVASPLAPIGLARQAELDPGFAFDAPVLGAGALLVAVLVIARTAAATLWVTRPTYGGEATSRRGSGPRWTPWSRPTVALGAGMALQSGVGGSRLAVQGAVGGVVLGITAITAVVVVGANLDSLLVGRELHGWNWDVAMGSYSEPESAEEGARSLVANPDVAAFSGIAYGPLTVDGIDVDVAAVTTDHGLVSSPVIDGRHPEAAGEIALGTATLRALGKGIGDEVQLTLGAPASVPARVVGTVVPPAVIDRGMTLASGAVMTAAGADEVVGEVVGEIVPQTFLVRLAPEVDREMALERLRDDFDGTVLLPTLPNDLENLRRVRGLPLVLAGLIGMLGLATLVHAQVTTVRRRRHDLAVLRAMGFVRRQVRATVRWQATTLAAIALAVGLPLGLLTGRWAWTEVVDRVGVLAATDIPMGALLITVVAVVVLADLVAAVSAGSAVRAGLVQTLRSE
jgi:hypothetical protein